MEAGINLYSLRKQISTEADFLATANRLREMGYSYIQFSGGPYDADMIARVSKESGLPVVLTHVPMDRILGEPSPDWGISDEKRLEFTKDTRESLDAYDIGWTMWSYNEAHTVFKPGLCRKYYTPTHEEFLEWYDKDLIEDALGLTPNFEFFETK